MFDLKVFAGAKHSGTIEKGDYLAAIDHVEWVKSSAGEMMLVATISIILAHGGKKVVRDYFNLFNKSKQAAEISASRLMDLTGACGLSEPPSDAKTFEKMQLWIKVGVDSKGYNTIDRYMFWKPIDNTAVMKSRACTETRSSLISKACNDNMDNYKSLSDNADDYEDMEAFVVESF